MGKKHHKGTSERQVVKEHKPDWLDRHWTKVIIAALVVLPVLYFSSYISPDRMMAGSDYVLGGYSFEKWTTEQPGTPLWYPHVFGGIPVLGSPVGGPFAPLAALRGVLTPQVVLTLSFMIFFALAGIGVYWYLREVGVSPYAAALGAFGFQFAGNLATMPEAGHAGRAASIALFPLMLFTLQRAVRTRRLTDFVWLALVAAFGFYEGHFQITYYGLLFILAYVIYLLVARRREFGRGDLPRIIGYGLVSIALICCLMAMIWLPVLTGLGTAARGVDRGFEYAASWAMPLVEVFDLFVPQFSGGLQNYWSLNAFKQHTEHFGIIFVVLGLWAIVTCWKKRYLKFYALAFLAALLVAVGSSTPVFRLFYTFVPGIKIMRAHSLAFYLAAFSCIAAGAHGFDQLILKKGIAVKRFLIMSGATVAVLVLLLFAIAPSLGRSVAGRRIGVFETNYPAYLGGVWLALFAVIVLCVLGYLALRSKVSGRNLTLILIIGHLVLQIPLVRSYLPQAAKPEQLFAADDVVRFLKQDPSLKRVLPMQYARHDQDLYLLYHDIQSAGGYIANPIQRYQDFIGAGQSVMFSPANLVEHPQLVNMLACNYVLGPNLPDDVSGLEPQVRSYVAALKTFFSRYRLVFRGYQSSVYANDRVLPRAYVVGDYVVVGKGEAMSRLRSSDFDPRRTVVLEDDPGVPHPSSPTELQAAEIVEYAANRVVCQVDCPNPGFLVLADNWHPDWRARVDGQRVPVYTANHTFRAVSVPAGEHEVIFEYVSSGFVTGRVITWLALAVCVFLIAVSFRRKHPEAH